MSGQDRNHTIDIIRGVAVMGIVLMNIIAFSMPQAAYLNPIAWGGEGLADQLVWMAGFVLVDGKLRGLFSLLFGASLLMLIERTEMAGGDGRQRHIIRCCWLALIGLAHYLLLWWGDILSLYAVVGLIALAFVGKQPLELVKLSFLAFALQFLILIAVMVGLYQATGAATAPGADPQAIAYTARMLDGIGQPGSALITADVALHRGGWEGIVADKAAHLPGWWLSGLHYTGLEILGFMLMGMAMLKGGFLVGLWPRAQYLATARHCFLIGLPPMIAMALWAWGSGFATVTTFGISFAWSLPFRLPLTIGLAALIFALIAGREDSAALARIGAVGRMALTNYLATSLVLTAIFYGWGLGLFGTMSRAQVYLVVPLVWAAMLFWSRPWLRRFRYGPAEWVWRSLTLFAPQPMRIAAPKTGR
ncbi:MAG: hypothetical protein B7Z20_01595 [Sphingobium sp. 32-64-5]|nr:MAG: hypothetical protein B7Z20_01595 [Sphingobium sp. 32-64-5]